MDPSFVSEYAEAVYEYRKQKDHHFLTSPDSPIPPEEQSFSEGLHYFPPDLSMRVLAEVEHLPAGSTIEMQTTDGSVRSYIRYAKLVFDIDDRTLTLTGFVSTEDLEEHEGHNHPPTMFVPFRDTLSGRETYGAGRYLDVEEDVSPDGENTIAALDFNLAYNPYCAYSDDYSCAITPIENTLPVPIRAGEKIYREHE